LTGLREAKQAEMVRKGELIPIVHLDWTSDPDFPDLPNLSNYIDDPDARAVIDFFLLPFASGRPIAVPEEVPADRLAALRSAFDATVNDPEFLAAVASRNWSIDAISGQDVEDICDQLYATSVETLRSVREILAPPR
jgi:hypothetical protein